jgi:phenylacetate-coenzyme A ligase PaaK-like adenylate-forming protein
VKLAISRKNLWQATPAFLKRGLGEVLSLAPMPLLLGRRFREHAAFVAEAQWWSAERAREYQLERLRHVVARAYDKTPFYRRAFGAAGFAPADLRSLEDLSRLPTIDKDTLRAHLDELCAVSARAPGVDYVSTGGTSGVPFHFYVGAGRSAVEYAYLVSGWGRAGYRLGTPLAVFRGKVVEEDDRGLRHEYDPLLRHHYYSNFHMSDGDMHRYVEHVRGIGPCYLHVYPSSGAALARFALRAGLSPLPNVRGVIAESEPAWPDQRVLIERVFGVRLFSSYGHSEKLVLAAECESSTDYHVWPTYGYFELLDPEGRPLTAPGERGEITGTGFINDVMPFIRYRTGDFATLVAERCKDCGRDQVLIRDIQGRRPEGCLVAGDGSIISMTALNMHDDTFERVRQYQLGQDTPGRAELRLVPGNGFSDDDGRRVVASLDRKLEGRVTLTLRVVDEIKPTPRGKHVLVDQRIRGVE